MNVFSPQVWLTWMIGKRRYVTDTARFALLWNFMTFFFLTRSQWIYYLQTTTAVVNVPSSYSPSEGVYYNSGIPPAPCHIYICKSLVIEYIKRTFYICFENPQQVAEGGAEEEDSSSWPHQVTSINHV